MNVTAAESRVDAPSLTRRLEALLADGSVWRMKDLLAQGIPASTVRRAVATGAVEAVSRGVYRWALAEPARGSSFAEVIARVRDGVICLFSAAEFHGLTDELPPEVWVAIPNHRHAPRISRPPVRVVQWRMSRAFDIGVEDQTICGVRVRITNAARTTIDMMRMRATVGEDRALESLRAYAVQGKAPQDLRLVADQMGISRMLIPYIKMVPFLR